MALLQWYDKHQRDLPWRRNKDPYAIWVSEVMLQQTRVATAEPYFRRWMRRFPTVYDVAVADEADVLAVWSGLGYYRRAQQFRAACVQVASHGFPKTAAAWQELPGVGPYTAAAIASMAYGEPVACIDGNVRRVVARRLALADDATRGVGAEAVRAEANRWLDAERPGDHNQAVMELGATICLPQKPHCDRCPVAMDCQGRATPERYPAPAARTKQILERPVFGITVRGGAVAMLPVADGLLAGTLLPPRLDEVGDARVLGTFRHVFSHRIWEATVVATDEPPGAVWVPLNRLDDYPLSAAARKALALANPE